MPPVDKQSRLNIVAAALLSSVFCVTLQMQFKLFANESYIGLRINITDLLLPIIGLCILGSLVLKKSLWPYLQKPFGIFWLLAISATIACALLHSYAINGVWLNWALVNKGIGWLVLMAYFAAGAWLTTNMGTGQITRFIRIFSVFFVAVSAGYTSLQILYDFGFTPIPTLYFNHYQLEGLMSNRNAFAFLFAVTTALINVLFLKDNQNLPPIWIKAFWFLFPIFLLFNASRALWIVAGPLCLYLIYKNKKRSLTHIILPALAGILFVVFAVPQATKDRVIFKQIRTSHSLLQSTGGPSAENAPDLYVGDHMRIKVIKTSLSVWKNHIFFGGGLGAGLEKQKEVYGETLSTIDNTLLWLLTDTGLVGALIFVSTFIIMIISLRKSLKNPNTTAEQRMLAHLAILMLLLFGTFSLFHEILYSRFMWFILGLALAAPADQALAPARKTVSAAQKTLPAAAE